MKDIIIDVARFIPGLVSSAPERDHKHQGLVPGADNDRAFVQTPCSSSRLPTTGRSALDSTTTWQASIGGSAVGAGRILSPASPPAVGAARCGKCRA